MKKLLLLAFLLALNFGFSQEGYHYLSLRGGQTLNYASEDRSTQVALGLEFNSRYFNSWELEFEAMLQNEDKNKEAYLVNVVYEPKIVRNKNSLFNLRIGSSIGSQQQEFDFGLLAGLEYSYTLPGNFKIFIASNTNFLVRADQNLRNTINAGFKIPF